MAFNLVSEFRVEDRFTNTIRNAERQMRRFIRVVEETRDTFREVERSVERVDNEIRSMTTATARAVPVINRVESSFNRVERSVQGVTNEIQQATVAAAALGTTLNAVNVSDSNAGGLLGGGSSGAAATGLHGTLVKIAATFPVIVTGATAAIAATAPLVQMIGGLGAGLIAAGAGSVGYAAVAIPALTQVFEAVDEIAKAEEKLEKAETYKQRIKAQKELNALYEDMSESQKKAVRGLQTFKSNYMDLVQEFEDPVFEAFAGGLQFIDTVMKKLEPTIQNVSTVVVDMMDKLNASMESPAATDFFNWLSESAAPSLSNFGKIANNTIGGVLGLFQAFSSETDDIETGLINITQRFEDWAQGLEDSQGFKNFIEYAEENGPVLMETLGNIAGSIENIIRALAPMGTDSLETIRNFTGHVESLSEKMVGLSTAAQNLTEPIGGVGTASKIAMGPVGWLALSVDDLAGGANALKNAWTDTWDSIVRKTADGVGDVIGAINTMIETINKVPGVNISSVSTPNWVKDNTPVPMSGAPKQTSRQQPFRTPTAFRNLPIQFPSSPALRGYSDGLARVKEPSLPLIAHQDEAILTATQSNTLRSMGVLKANGDRPVLDTSAMSGKTAAVALTGSAKTSATNVNIEKMEITINGAQKTTKEMARELVTQIKYSISNGALAGES